MSKNGPLEDLLALTEKISAGAATASRALRGAAMAHAGTKKILRLFPVDRMPALHGIVLAVLGLELVREKSPDRKDALRELREAWSAAYRRYEETR